ncbi:hypothetical protein Egran_01585 [Elaphomyces granulatus]|uniref:GATA-type domain-containing protein n=1 Tax=Elaphomyces granulatus TaxID=519963 RepID=A0A232M2M2_9EURO|nr:hypothetical protein Egran_01585 [Elaphomyces granulatus]
MGTLEVGSRHRDHLPSIGLLDFEQIRKDGVGYQKYPTMLAAVGVSTAPLVSPTTMYPGPAPPYSYPPSACSGPPQSGLISPSDLRQTVDDEKEQLPSQSLPQRQSLPSIHEALGNDNHLPYPGPPSSGPPSQSAHHAPPAPLAPSVTARSGVDGPAGPPNPFSNGSSSTTFLRESSFSHQSCPTGQSQGEGSRSSLTSISTQDSRKESLHSLSSGKSPTQSARTAATSLSTSQNSSYEYNGPPSASTMASPNGYSPYPQSYSYQSQPQPPNSQSPYHHTSYDSRSYSAAPWKPGTAEQPRVEDAQRGLGNRLAQPQGDSAKRQLEGCDVESSLSEVCLYQEEFKGGGGFAGADAKKRRGKAAPPGRCHSCQRAETPEWRRGPDGARTLCNACGLHYAKLTRKMGANKASAMSSNLKTKSSLDSVSPTHR